MKIKYMITKNELALVMEDDLSPCAVSLDLVGEIMYVSPIRFDLDVHGGTMVDVESGLIYWGIPQITTSAANALLDHIAPLAEIIISRYCRDIDYSEVSFDTSSQIAMNQISQYIHDQEFLESEVIDNVLSLAFQPHE